MIEATKVLRWNGVCFADPAGNPGGCNDNAGGQRPVAPEERVLAAHPSAEQEHGVVAELMRFEVNIVRVAPVFSSIKEYVGIEVRFKGIDEIRQMVLQIRNCSGQLVYAERLAAAKVWGLPDAID